MGSDTTTFVAAAVLQLVGEGKVDLDATLDEHLPGLVRGEGIDGRTTTVPLCAVRQPARVLQHPPDE